MPGDSAEAPVGPDLPPPLVSVEFDGDESVTTSVLTGVSAVSERPATDLPLLNNTIDTDALEALFARGSDSPHLLFRFAGYLIGVRDDTVRIYDSDATST